MKKARVLLFPSGGLREELFPPAVMDELNEFAEVCFAPDKALSRTELAELIKDKDAILTSWGSPQFDKELLAPSQVAFIGHAAGSLRPIVTKDAFETGLKASSCAPVIAAYVGEACLLSALAGLRRLTLNDSDIRAGNWRSSDYHIFDSLFRQTVGLLSLSLTARAFIKLLEPFDCRILVYDPYASTEEAEELGVTLTSLEELLQTCPVVSVHTPSLPETRHLLNKERLALLADDSLLINTARGTIIDEEALVDELKTGRISAVLDVFDPEPPAEDHPLRQLSNTILTPHIAGPARKRYWEMGQAMVEDCRRVLAGEPQVYGFDGAKYEERA